MKTYKLFTLFILFTLVLVSACKKKEDVIEEPATEPITLEDEQVFLSFQNQREAAELVLEIGDSLNILPIEAFLLALPYIRNFNGVESAYVADSTYLIINTTGGYQSTISINEVDADGISKYRGSKNGSGRLKHYSKISNGSINKIKKKKVLVLAPVKSEFYRWQELETRVINVIKNGEADVEVITLINEQCVPEIIETFDQYGLVLLEAHGLPYAFVTGMKLEFLRVNLIGSVNNFKQLLLSQVGLKYYRQFKEKQLSVGMTLLFDPSLQIQDAWNTFKSNIDESYDVKVTSKGIRENMPQLDSTVIFANNCYSGHSVTQWKDMFGDLHTVDPIKPAWMSKNPISLYAYESALNGVSYQVLTDDAKVCDDTLLHSFFYDGDSTGNAHKFGGTTVYEMPRGGVNGNLRFNQYGRQTWSYDLCIDSIIDVRDNEVYKVVCIGDQIWMAENLRWAGAGSCYDGIQASCDTFGRLYTWNEFTGGIASSANPSGVQGICPDGWHVPSKPEWLQLMNAVGGQTVAGRELKANSALWVDAPVNTDTYGFSALPAGVCSLDSTLVYYCYNEDDFANFWSSSMIINDPVYYWIGSIDYMGELSSPPMYADKLSCRCVKD
jgi:uncharacterized protein (TIGR02145 family)